MNMTMDEYRKSREPRALPHEWVGGPYPFESHYHCKKCGLDDQYHWYMGALTGGECVWVKFPDKGVFETKCERCGTCDCADGHHGEAELCHVVGECSGMWYDIYYNERTGECICEACFEAVDV